MASEGTKKETGGTKLPDFFKGISPDYGFIDYLKRFFYQIIGIYFPATILFLYIFLFWYIGDGKDPIQYYNNPSNFIDGVWPLSLVNNTSTIRNTDIGNQIQILELIIFVIGIVILGEGINALTSRITMLSPITTSVKDALLFGIRNKSFPAMSAKGEWPIWLNETSFPVSFAQFDRYYVSALEQDKRTLAGKIGWVSFYRNMVAVFVIIIVLQLFLSGLTTGLLKPQGYAFYVWITAGLAIALFLFGYWAQVKSNKGTLWDAYRRYELRKNLEIRYGDLILAFGIKDEYKTKALEYMVDRWFLGADNTIQTISRHFLSNLEERYVKLFECKQMIKEKNNGHPIITNSYPEERVINFEREIKDTLTDAYSDWNIGAYERVIANVSKKLEQIKIFLKEYRLDIEEKVCLRQATETARDIKEGEGQVKNNEGIWKDYPAADDWKTILGFYILENSLRTDAAFVEISRNLSNRGWTIQNDNESVKNKDVTKKEDNSSNPTSAEEQIRVKSNLKGEIHDFYTVDEEKDKKIYDQMANLIRETSDDYQRAFLTIMDTLKIFNKLLSEHKLEQDQKEKCFSRLKSIYYLFGGYDYVNARKEAEDFFNGINQSGSTYLTLKSKGYFYRENFIGDSTNLLDKITEEATITEIKNPTPFKLSKVYHRDPNGRQAEICLESNNSQNIDQEQIMVAGEWNVESGESSLPEQLRIQIRWKAPIKKT